MNPVETTELANLYKNIAVTSAMQSPDAAFAIADLKAEYERAAEGRAEKRSVAIDKLCYNTATALQSSLCDLFTDFAYRYIQHKISSESTLNIHYENVVTDYAPSVTQSIENLSESLCRHNQLSKEDFLSICKVWLDLDFAVFASQLDEKYDSSYLETQLNKQLAKTLIEHIHLAHSPIAKKLIPYKSGRKLVLSLYSTKNEWSSNPYSREFYWRDQDKIRALPVGFKRAAEVMGSEELNDAALAMDLMRITLERQGWGYDSRSKESFGASTVTLFNEKLELSMSKDASTKLIIFLRKYGNDFLHDAKKLAA